MTEKEFSNKGLHNKHIEFLHKGKKLSGFLMFQIPSKTNTHSSIYTFVQSSNAWEWQEAQRNNDDSKMKKLSSDINISDIEEAYLI